MDVRLLSIEVRAPATMPDALFIASDQDPPESTEDRWFTGRTSRVRVFQPHTGYEAVHGADRSSPRLAWVRFCLGAP
jgi:hypothetical protein